MTILFEMWKPSSILYFSQFEPLRSLNATMILGAKLR